MHLETFSLFEYTGSKLSFWYLKWACSEANHMPDMNSDGAMEQVH